MKNTVQYTGNAFLVSQPRKYLNIRGRDQHNLDVAKNYYTIYTGKINLVPFITNNQIIWSSFHW